ncbi:magnesium transporter [Nocardia otitidiscaviarum]|nr:magnesium transporter [Nocardia otitidiscaviarum]MCP9618744.1 magnesium transporter [Nocardia otitidiscaviarum]
MESRMIAADVLDTAAAHATRDVPVVEPAETVRAALAGMQGRRFASAAVVVVCRDGYLAGLVTIERLLAAPPDSPVGEVMDTDPPTVAGHHDQEAAVWEALRHDEPGLAVVDADGRWLGVIPPQRLLGLLLAEHDEDVARLSGYLASTSTARTATTEPVARRLWHRLPWLAVGFVGAMLAAGVVDAFRGQLKREVLIAFFIPGVVYLADAVGTQTVALVVRGLSVGVGIRGIVVRESVTGAVIGLLVAAVSYAFTLAVWGDAEVSAAVAIALLAACSVAAVVAMVLPWALSRLGIDPAFGSGPLATVIQDLLSIVIYLGVTSLVVT